MRVRADESYDDRLLNMYFPQLGPCGICGSGLPQRHRVVDAIADRLGVGETPRELAADYGLPLAAVLTVSAWTRRWPEREDDEHPV